MLAVHVFGVMRFPACFFTNGSLTAATNTLAFYWKGQIMGEEGTRDEGLGAGEEKKEGTGTGNAGGKRD